MRLRTRSGVELARMLFPDAKWCSGTMMSSPFRSDSTPSLSFFRGYQGIWRWKDHGTGESGDNIDFYRKVFPEYGYVDAVDRLSWLLLGRSALKEYDGRMPVLSEIRRNPYPIPVADVTAERRSALNVILDESLDRESVPEYLRDYWRGRAIPDSIMIRLCRHVIFENTNKTLRRIDPSTGKFQFNDRGEYICYHPSSDAIGMYNDIGGMNFRVPPTEKGKGFKGATSSFLTTILDNGSRPVPCVRFGGEGDGRQHFLRYDDRTGCLFVNNGQYFEGMSQGSLPFVIPFLRQWDGKALEPPVTRRICAVISSLCCPVHSSVMVVEGMFDGLSKFAFCSLGKTSFSSDLVVLNSVSNLKWAVPFLARHESVFLMLDNDMKSSAGQKATSELSSLLGSYCATVGVDNRILPCSEVFAPYKDLNECLMAYCGKSLDTPSVQKDSQTKTNSTLNI